VEELDEIINQRANAIIENNDNAEIKEFEFKPNEEKSLKDQAKDFVGAMAVQQAVKDTELVEDLTEKAKEELIENATANLKEEKAKSKQADISLQSAEYGVFEGVATYAGIKKPLPKKMQAILFVILSIIQTAFLIIIGTPISIINILADCIDSVVKKLSTIAKSSMWLVLVLLIALIVGIVLIILKKNAIIP
jgi:hypothetical protein